MKAVVYRRYGSPDVLELVDVPKPAPKDDEILIRVLATTVSVADWRARSLSVPPGFGPFARLVFGVFRPRQPILGTELAGEVAAVGKSVRNFKVGDQVFAFPGIGMGAHAEYKSMPENGAVALKPANLSYEEAAAISFGGTTALHFLRKAKIQRGEKVLVNGASGAVGTAAVQLAKHFGAEVTGVSSTRNLELLKSIGADKVIDYTREDFTRNGETYDVIMDTVGTADLSRTRHSLKEGGRLLLVFGTFGDLLQSGWVSMTSGRKIIAGTSGGSAEDLRFLAALAESGAYKPVIDRRYPLEQIVEAHRYVDAGHKRGNVVITLDSLQTPRG